MGYQRRVHGYILKYDLINNRGLNYYI